MNWADWLIIIVILISTLFSLQRGFVKEALSLAVWVTAFVIARTFSFNLAVILANYIELYSVRVAAAFALLFAGTLIVGALISHLVGAMIRATGLSGTDRLLGMVFGAIRGGLIMVVVVALLKHTPLAQDPWWEQSYLIPEFLVMEEWSFNFFKEVANYVLAIGEQNSAETSTQ